MFAAHGEEPGQPGAYLQRPVRLADVCEVDERGVEVLPLVVDQRDPLHLLRGAQLRFGFDSQGSEVLSMPFPRLAEDASLGQPVDAVFADGLEHAVARSPAAEELQQ